MQDPVFMYKQDLHFYLFHYFESSFFLTKQLKRRMSMKTIIFSLFVLTIATQSHAQHDSVKIKGLNPVVVTASKTDIKQSQTGKIVTVLDAETIKQNAGRTLPELLNMQTSFMMVGSNNSMGTNVENYFRGAPSGNLLIVIDGVPVTDPSQISNSFDLNSIPLEQIERIEILKGGQSTIWGSDAVAGVVQIFLKEAAAKPLAVHGTFSYGTYGSLRTGVGVDGSINKFSYRIQYNYQQSKGFSSAYDSLGNKGFDQDGFSQNNLEAELKYSFSKYFSAKFLGTLSDYHYALDESAYTDDQDFTGKNKNKLGALSLNYYRNNLNWNTLISYQKANRGFTDDSNYISSPYAYYSNGVYSATNFTAESYVNYHFQSNMQLVGGLQYLHQKTDQDYVSLGSYGTYADSLGSDSAQVSQFAGYASYLITNLAGFDFEAGIRANHHSIYGNNFTYTLNPSYHVNEFLKVFLNISSAYKIPSLYQLFGEYGNKGLKPESSTTYELGAQAETKTGSMIRVAGFIRNTKDLIVFYTDPVTYSSEYVNQDSQQDYGFELEANLRFGKAFYWINNLSYVDGQGREGNTKTYNLYRRPKFIVNSRLNWQATPRLMLAPAIRYVGPRQPGTYDIGPDPMPSYYNFDFFCAYQLKQFRVFANIQNITNQKYFDIYGYRSKGFNMMAGVDINF
jgi:vitamin B12 transporter